jgi:fibronectin type 3 domain-containing protein
MIKNWPKRLLIGLFSVILATNSLTASLDASALSPYEITRNGNQVILNWSDVENAEEYNLVKIVNDVEQAPVSLVVSDYTDGDTLPNYDYKYRVTARVLIPVTEPEEGEEEQAPEEAIEVTEELFTTSVVRYGLGKLTASSKSTSYNSVTLSYGSVHGASEYEIYRSTKKTSGFKKIATTSNTSYTNKSLAVNSTYYYKVRGKQISSGKAYYTNWSSIFTKKTVIGKSTIKVSKKTYNSVKLSWTKADGATKYKVYRSTKKTSGYKAIKTVTGTSYTNKSLKTGTTYYYKLVPYRGTAKGAATKIVSAKLVLSKPKVSYSTPVAVGSVKVKWSKVSGASGYKLYRATSKSGNYKLIKTTKSTSYTNKKLKNNKTYYYKVKAYRTVGSKRVHSSSSTPSKVVTSKKEGKYRYTKGTWVVLETNSKYYGKYTICGTSGCSYSRIVEDELFKNKAYVYVKKNHYLIFSTTGKKGTITNLEYDYGSYKSSFSTAGVYLVGHDIKPGTYKLEGLDYFFCISSTFICESPYIYEIESGATGVRYLDLYIGDFLDISIYRGKLKAVRL